MALNKLFHTYLFVTAVSYSIHQCTCTQNQTATVLGNCDNYNTRVFRTGFTFVENNINSATHSFKDLVCCSRVFVDNTLLIRYAYYMTRLVVTLPRAFGKTINLDMIKYFFGMEVDKNTLTPIPPQDTDAYQTFERSRINCTGKYGKYRELKDRFLVTNSRDEIFYELLGAVPIVHLVMGQLNTINTCVNDIYEVVKVRIRNAILDHEYILYALPSEVNPKIQVYQETYKTLQASLSGPTVNDVVLASAIPTLIHLLQSIFEKKVFVLIDEYDAILNDVFFGNSILDKTEREKTINFFALFYGELAKQNYAVDLIFMTGIVCWRGCGIFASLSRLHFHTVSGGDAIKFYGINEDTVQELLNIVGLIYTHATVMDYYNGYNFGTSPAYIRKYNSYAIARYIAANGNANEMAYWTESSDICSMLKHLIKYRQFHDEFLILLQDNAIKIRVNNGTTTFLLSDFNRFSEAIIDAKEAPESEWYGMKSSTNADEVGFNILLTAGYLTESISHPPDLEETQYSEYRLIWVRVTNKEIRDHLWSAYISIVNVLPNDNKRESTTNAYWRSQFKNCGDALRQILHSHVQPDLQTFALAFEKLISLYIPITWKITGEGSKAYANEALFETLFTSTVNVNIYDLGIERFETQHQFDFEDKRKPDEIFKSVNNVWTLFELKYFRGNQWNVAIIQDTLKNVTLQALGYAQWYLWGKHGDLYRSAGVRVIVLLVTEFKKRVVMRTTFLPKYDEVMKNINWYAERELHKNLKIYDHWPDPDSL